MAKLPAALEKFVRESKMLDKMMRYMYLIDYGRKLGDFPEEEKTEANRVRGCTSVVYISSSYQDGKMYYKGFADAQIVRGMVAVLVNSLSGLTPDEIVQIDPDFIKESGITESVTPTRQGGFANIFRRMQEDAAPYATVNTN